MMDLPCVDVIIMLVWHVQRNSNINKGILYAATNTYWLQQIVNTKKDYIIFYCNNDNIITL